MPSSKIEMLLTNNKKKRFLLNNFMNKRDQDNIARLYLEGWYNEYNKNMGYDDDFEDFDDSPPKSSVQATNLATDIIRGVFEYGNEFTNPYYVVKSSNPEILKQMDNDHENIVIIALDIPYSIMGVEGDDAVEFIEDSMRSHDSSGYGGGKYVKVRVLRVDESEQGDGWARYTIKYINGYDI